MTDRNAFRLEGVSPVFRVTDMKRSLDYYVDQLLFATDFEWPSGDGQGVDYAVLKQGDTELHLTRAKEAHRAVAYFLVRDVQAFYDAVKAKGAHITRGIADQPFEMREFEVTDPDGNRLVFGEHLSRVSS